MKNFWIAATALTLLAGCQTTADDGVHAVQPMDINVPLGMKLKTRLHRSDSLKVGRYRYANLVYEGRTPPAKIASYLLDRMPKHSYRVRSQEKTSENTEQIVFERGPYVSTCSIQRLKAGSRLEIRVRTHPKL